MLLYRYLLLITQMAELTITVEDYPDSKDIRAVIANILDYNNSSQKQKDVAYPLTFHPFSFGIGFQKLAPKFLAISFVTVSGAECGL